MSKINVGTIRAELEPMQIVGKQIFSVSKAPMDLEYNDRVKRNDGTRPVKPYIKYYVKSYDIIGMMIIQIDGKPHVEYTVQDEKLPTLVFPVGKMDFKKTDLAAIQEALNNQNPIYFDNPVRLTQLVNQLNKMECEKAEAEAERLLKMSSAWNQLTKKHCDDLDTYLNELGLSSEEAEGGFCNEADNQE
jgi:hypothetical protein